MPNQSLLYIPGASMPARSLPAMMHLARELAAGRSASPTTSFRCPEIAPWLDNTTTSTSSGRRRIGQAAGLCPRSAELRSRWATGLPTLRRSPPRNITMVYRLQHGIS